MTVNDSKTIKSLKEETRHLIQIVGMQYLEISAQKDLLAKTFKMIAFMKDKKADVRKEIAEKKAIDDELKAKLVAAVGEFKKGFIA